MIYKVGTFESNMALKANFNIKIHFTFFNVPTLYILGGDTIAFQLQKFVTNFAMVQKILNDLGQMPIPFFFLVKYIKNYFKELSFLENAIIS